MVGVIRVHTPSSEAVCGSLPRGLRISGAYNTTQLHPFCISAPKRSFFTCAPSPLRSMYGTTPLAVKTSAAFRSRRPHTTYRYAPLADNRQTTDFRQLHSVVDFEHPGFRGPSSLTVSGITSVPKTRMTHSRARWPSFVSSRQGPSVAGFSSACPCRWRYRALSGYKPRMKK